ncbi:MAG: hcl 1 [Solirubrobacterales bacterium]|jgi:acetyl-CoA synthetase|nr:hcl 1 [Solirubrobacterales bacterium]
MLAEPDLVVELPGSDYDESRARFEWAVPPEFNLAAACIERHPADAIALIADHDDGEPREYTFGDMDALASRLGNALTGLGLERGDRVAVMVPQGAEVAATHFACYKAGFVTTPMSVQFGPDAVAYRLEHAEARALIIYAEGLDRLGDLLQDLPSIVAVLVVGGDGTAAARTRTRGPRFLGFEDAIADASPSLPAVPTTAEDPALLLYTSGTTGNPKGVLHMHRWVIGNMPGFRFSHNFYPRGDDRFWTPADWAWGGGIIDALLPTLFCGRPIVASRRKFEPEWAYTLMGRHQVRGSFLPPTALKRMRQEGDPPADVHMRSIACGGEALGESLLAWTEEKLGVVINEFYGQTEANLFVGNCSERWPVRPGSMGRVYPGFEVEIRGEDDRPVAPGEQGEIVLKLPSATAFREYWRDPERTAEKTRGGWLRSGDLGRVDEDGYLWFEGRTDDLIGSAGYRIGPTEIEECLMSHPGVALSAVIGVSDELRGQAVMAFVVPAAGAAPDEDLSRALKDHVKHRLAFYQYPREIRFVEELPMTTTGKIMRRTLRQQIEAERGASA